MSHDKKSTLDIVKEIENQILSGEYKEGDRLPSEREFAEKMNISKTMSHQIFSILSSRGFIKVIPRQGTFVDNYIKNGKLECLEGVVEYNNGKFSTEMLNSLMDTRLLIEGECAYLSAKNRTQEDIDNLKNQYIIIKSANTNEELTFAIYEFHLLIAYSTKNTIYPLMFNTFKKVLCSFYLTVFDTFGIGKVKEQLKNIIDLIIEQKCDEAKLAMQQLVASSNNELFTGYFKK